jgi:(1->4)-alpha-D-glucan 1-alpha-D-glucosylmutase
VDWGLRASLRTALEGRWAREGEREALLKELVDHAEDGRIKLHVTMRALALRAIHEPLFSGGRYEPMLAAGPLAHHVFAFARRQEEDAILTLAPRLPLTLVGNGRAPAGASAWRDTYLPLPPELAGRVWRCALGDHVVQAELHSGVPVLPLGEVFRTLPVAILVLAK